jgi:hypothetical protein
VLSFTAKELVTIKCRHGALQRAIVPLVPSKCPGSVRCPDTLFDFPSDGPALVRPHVRKRVMMFADRLSRGDWRESNAINYLVVSFMIHSESG